MHVLEEEFMMDIDACLEAALNEKVYIMRRNGAIVILSKAEGAQE